MPRKRPALRTAASMLLCLLAVAAARPRAHANGRFPATSTIHFREGSPMDIFVGTTYGAILSHDRGASWRWICEQSMNYTGGIDPVFAWSRRGDLFGATFSDLIVSRDQGCTFSPHPFFNNRGVSDVLEHPSTDDLLYAVTSGAGLGNETNGLYRSSDAGRTFTATSLLRQNVFMSAVRIPKTQQRRFYVSGWRAQAPKAAWIYLSDDDGQTWTEVEQPEVVNPIYFYVLAVSPTNADVVFTLSTTTTSLGDTVRRSEDGGRTSTVVLEEPEGVKHLAISPDGNTVWVAGQTRIYRSTDAGRSFVLADGGRASLPFPTKNACVTHSGTDLWACGWEFNEDCFSLAKSTSSGTTWTPVYRLAQVKGPISCPAGTPTHDLCEPLWPQLAALLGIRFGADGGPIPPNSACGGSDAGAPGTDGGATSDGGAMMAPPKSCGCTSTQSGMGGALWALSALMLTWLRRRRTLSGKTRV